MAKKSFISVAILLVVVCGASLFIYWAAGPAATTEQLDLSGIRDFTSPAIQNKAAPPQELTVVSYNIGYASGDKNNRPAKLTEAEVRENLDKMILELQPLGADIIALQEVDFGAKRTHDIDQLEYLARGLNLAHAAFVVTWNKRYVAWPYWPPMTQFGRMVSGQAVLSRYPIIDQQLFPFKKPPENAWWYNLFYPNRVAQRLTIQFNGEVAIVWNIHLEAFKAGTRLHQVDKLLGHLNGDSHPYLIVAGDFNSIKGKGEGIQKFMAESALKDSSTKLTFPSWKPDKKIDYVLYKGPQLLEDGVIEGLTASDHLPVWAKFKLN